MHLLGCKNEWGPPVITLFPPMALRVARVILLRGVWICRLFGPSNVMFRLELATFLRDSRRAGNRANVSALTIRSCRPDPMPQPSASVQSSVCPLSLGSASPSLLDQSMSLPNESGDVLACLEHATVVPPPWRRESLIIANRTKSGVKMEVDFRWRRGGGVSNNSPRR